MNTNPELELANTLIAQTGTNIFLTGKAGTGKTDNTLFLPASFCTVHSGNCFRR